MIGSNWPDAVAYFLLQRRIVMLDLVKSYPMLVIGIVTPLLLAIGYFYRARRESKKNQKLALYSLMEIWHRMSVFYKSNFDDVFDKVMSEVQKHYPQEEFSNEGMDAAKAFMTPILIQTAREAAFSDLDGYLEKYQEAVSLIASDDPIFAYRINFASSTGKILGCLDSYFRQILSGQESHEAGQAVFSFLRESMTERMQIESLKELESNIKQLSIKISFRTLLASVLAINKRKRMLDRMDDSLVNEMVSNVLVPVISKLNEQLPTAVENVN